MRKLLFLALIAMAAACEKGYIPRAEISVADGVMTPEALLDLGRISNPQVSPDGTKVLYGVSYTSIPENRSCRNLILSDIDGSNRVELTHFGKSVSGERWAPDGKSIYFLQGGQLYRAPLRGGRLGRKQLLSSIPAGISEFSISPDGLSVLYTSTVKGPVLTPSDTDPSLDKADAYVAQDLMYRHWDHWVTTTPRSYVASLQIGRITPENSFDICDVPGVELPTEPFSGIEQLCWHPTSRYIAYSCRKLTGKQYAFSTNTDIYVYDILTGATNRITDGGGYDTDPVWSEDGLSLAWISMARDGYEADKQDLMVAQIGFPDCEDSQCGEVKVCSVKKIEFGTDAASPKWHEGKIYFSSIVQEAVQAIFCADPKSGQVRRLTSPDWKYDFFTPWHIKGQKLYTSYYCLNAPLELVRIDTEAGSFEQISSENAHILSQLDEPSSESVHIRTVDGKYMQAWVLYPPHFDESKVYPAIEIVLGGPQGTNSQDWSYRWCYRLMAQQGYIVIMPNRRGTTAFGQEWKEQISGDYCGLNMQDYLCAGRWIKSKPYVGKLACCGASYGGYSAYMLEGLHGDLYDCFIAHAGIFDEKQLWFTTEEMWFANWDNGGLTPYAFSPGETGPRGDGKTFGGMQQAGAPYSNTPKALKHYANSPASMVTKWHTPILCIHGGMDFRIPYEQGMAAFNAAQMMGVPSKLIVFPGENHWIIQPQNALFWHRSYFEWLDKWCKTNQ